MWKQSAAFDFDEVVEKLAACIRNCRDLPYGAV